VTDQLVIGIAQINPTVGDISGNIKKNKSRKGATPGGGSYSFS
jgi:hypothetical protein